MVEGGSLTQIDAQKYMHVYCNNPSTWEWMTSSIAMACEYNYQ